MCQGEGYRNALPFPLGRLGCVTMSKEEEHKFRYDLPGSERTSVCDAVMCGERQHVSQPLAFFFFFGCVKQFPLYFRDSNVWPMCV